MECRRAVALVTAASEFVVRLQLWPVEEKSDSRKGRTFHDTGQR